MRRTIMRYANLSLVLTFIMICPYVKKRFPTLEHLVQAGLMLPTELNRLKEMDSVSMHPKHWVPLVWACAVVWRARGEGRIPDDVSANTLILELNTFRSYCGGLLNYDWISIPLVYPQVVSWAVYTYFLASLLSNQFPFASHRELSNLWQNYDFVYPIFPMLEFFFYMGWLLVAETLANPFGDDDDDFEVNWIIDRNIQVSYMIVDEVQDWQPEMMRDQYWDDSVPPDLPHTLQSRPTGPPPRLGSTRDINPTHPVKSRSPLMRTFRKKRTESGVEWVGWSNRESFQSYKLASRSSEVASERIIQVFHHQSCSKLTFSSNLSFVKRHGSIAAESTPYSSMSAPKDHSESALARIKVPSRKNNITLDEETKKNDEFVDSKSNELPTQLTAERETSCNLTSLSDHSNFCSNSPDIIIGIPNSRTDVFAFEEMAPESAQGGNRVLVCSSDIECTSSQDGRGEILNTSSKMGLTNAENFGHTPETCHLVDTKVTFNEENNNVINISSTIVSRSQGTESSFNNLVTREPSFIIVPTIKEENVENSLLQESYSESKLIVNSKEQSELENGKLSEGKLDEVKSDKETLMESIEKSESSSIQKINNSKVSEISKTFDSSFLTKDESSKDMKEFLECVNKGVSFKSSKCAGSSGNDNKQKIAFNEKQLDLISENDVERAETEESLQSDH